MRLEPEAEILRLNKEEWVVVHTCIWYLFSLLHLIWNSEVKQGGVGGSTHLYMVFV